MKALSQVLGACLLAVAIEQSGLPAAAETRVVASVDGVHRDNLGQVSCYAPTPNAGANHSDSAGSSLPVLCYSTVSVPSVEDFSGLKDALEKHKIATQTNVEQKTMSEVALQLSKVFTDNVKTEIEDHSADKAVAKIMAKLNGEGWLLITAREVSQIKIDACTRTAAALNAVLKRDRKPAVPINCSGP
jgi:hypothetical protein